MSTPTVSEKEAAPNCLCPSKALPEWDVERLEAETASRQRATMEFYPDHGYYRVNERSFGEYDIVTFEKQIG